MFSQFRQAMEGLAQPQPRPSLDLTVSSDGLEGQSSSSTSSSPDAQFLRQSQSTNQLADSALNNMRRSFAAQRPGGTISRSSSPAPSYIPKSSSTPEPGLRKFTLEERLRASFSVGEASNSNTTTPSLSSRASPAQNAVQVIEQPLSPTSIPLPGSPTLPGTVSPPQVSHTQFNDPPALSPTIHHFENADEDGSQATSSSQVPLVSAVVSLSLSKEEKNPADNSDKPTAPLICPTVTAIISQLADHPPTEIDTAHMSEVQDLGSGIIDGESDDSNLIDASASDGGVAGDMSGTELPVKDIPLVSSKYSEADVEALQQRLRLVEQRFSDVSTSFKRLQAERSAADDVIRELTPFEDSKDAAVLRDYLSNMNMKVELAQDELQRLKGNLTRQEERFKELTDTHRLETKSQLDQIDKLRQQLKEAEALVSASQVSASQTAEDASRQNTEIEQLTAEVAKATEVAKEEEEKRVKAISLLKTVRQKLVKAEKERDDGLSKLGESKENERKDRDKERAEQARLQLEIDAVNAEREKAVAGLKTQFDKEIASVKDRSEKELSAARAQFEAEIAALKISHSTELSHKRSQIATLEASVNSLSRDNRTFFEQLQIRQAELESSQHHVGTLQSQNTELQFQLRESRDRVTLLTEEISDLRGDQDMRPQGPGFPQEDISQLMSAIEAKYEAKLAEMKRNLVLAEQARTESEADWSRKLCDKSRETDELKMVLQSSAKLREETEGNTGVLKGEIEQLTAEMQNHQRHASELQLRLDFMKDAETSLQLCISDAKAEAEAYRRQLEELKAHEVQLCGHLKTLREELRKVQTSAALLERQRNPGVGYWTSRTENTDSRVSISSMSDFPPRTASPGIAPSAPFKGDEEINLEYLRNVILQFLEHKEMRPNLVRVLSIILHFTPQETRRLIAKV